MASTTNTKVSISDFLAKRQESLDKIEKYKSEITETEINPLIDQFIASHTPYESGKVYELVKNGTKRRGFTRFVITEFHLHYIKLAENIKSADHVIIYASGFWLGSPMSTHEKHDTFSVFGVSNPAEFKLSENQGHYKAIH